MDLSQELARFSIGVQHPSKSCTLVPGATHFLIPECGCFAVTPLFSSTIHFACGEPSIKSPFLSCIRAFIFFVQRLSFFFHFFLFFSRALAANSPAINIKPFLQKPFPPNQNLHL